MMFRTQYLTSDKTHIKMRQVRTGQTDRHISRRLYEHSCGMAFEPAENLANMLVPDSISDGDIRKELRRNRGWKQIRLDCDEHPANQDPIRDWNNAIQTLAKKLNVVEHLGLLNTSPSHTSDIETPGELAKQIVEWITTSTSINFSDRNIKIIDPCCGAGTFLIAIFNELRKWHSAKYIIENMLYGVDINPAQCRFARAALYKHSEYESHNIYQDNSLESSISRSPWNMKFDLVIGNPPYQEIKDDDLRKDQASNLWSKFWKVSLGLSNRYVALVTTITWMSPSSDLRGRWKIGFNDRLWDCFNSASSYANVKDVKKHFPGVGSNFGYVIVDKLGRDGLKFSDGADTSFGCLPLNTDKLHQLKNVLSHENNIGQRFPISQGSSHLPYKVILSLTKRIRPDTIHVTAGNTSINKVELYIYTYTKEEAEKIRDFCLKNAKDINETLCWSGFLNIEAVRMLKYE